MKTGLAVQQEKIQRGSRDYRFAILALFFGSLAAFGTEYCVQPIIPVFTDTFGLDPAEASLAVSFGTGGMACAMLLIASFARRLPRKKIMAFGLITSAVLAILMALSPAFIPILILRLIQGILLAGFPALAVAYINEEFDAFILGAVIGIYVSGTSVGGLAGRVILSTFTDFFSWRVALLIFGILYTGIGIAFLLLLPEPRKKLDKAGKIAGWQEFGRLLRNRRLLGVYFIAFCVMGSFVCTYNFISYILLAPPYELSQTAIGSIYALYFLGTAASTIMGRLSDRLSGGPVICISVLCMMAGALVSLAAPLALKLVGIGLLTYGFFGAHSVACGWAGRLDSSDKARISSLYMFFYYLGASIIGTLGGRFLALWQWPGIVGFILAVLCVSLGIACWLMVTDETYQRRADGRSKHKIV